MASNDKSFEKFLILRFSSFGDVLQSLSIAGKIQQTFPNARVDWITRSEFSSLISSHPAIQNVYPIERKSAAKSLWKLASELAQKEYDVVYDAHNNLRSHLFVWFFRWHVLINKPFSSVIYLRKSQKRWKRFLLFQLRKNLFQMPFSGQRDLLEALQEISCTIELPPTPQLFIDSKSTLPVHLPAQFVALAPSSAHELKRWPVDYWSELISQNPSVFFVFLGGKEDLFIQGLNNAHPTNTLNLAGALTMMESAAVVSKSQLLITNDTGPLHLAEQLGHPAFALMGPAPFGFPSRSSTKIFQRDLICRPCSKHGQNPCINPNFHQCMRDIQVKEVHEEMNRFLTKDDHQT